MSLWKKTPPIFIKQQMQFNLQLHNFKLQLILLKPEQLCCQTDTRQEFSWPLNRSASLCTVGLVFLQCAGPMDQTPCVHGSQFPGAKQEQRNGLTYWGHGDVAHRGWRWPQALPFPQSRSPAATPQGQSWRETTRSSNKSSLLGSHGCMRQTSLPALPSFLDGSRPAERWPPALRSPSSWGRLGNTSWLLHPCGWTSSPPTQLYVRTSWEVLTVLNRFMGCWAFFLPGMNWEDIFIAFL